MRLHGHLHERWEASSDIASVKSTNSVVLRCLLAYLTMKNHENP